MSRLFYLVAATKSGGIGDAQDRGWTRIADTRFVTDEKDDIRVIWRMSDLIPVAGVTPMIKGSDYEDGPDDSGFDLRRWAGDETAEGEKVKFDRFISDGHGRWV